MSTKNSTDYVAYHRHLRQRLGQLTDELCGPLAGFARLHREAMTDGALDRKTKELMAFAIAVALGCEGCLVSHIHDALDAGAGREELLEAIGVALLMSGGPGTVYAAQALDAIEQFLPVADEEEFPALPEEGCQ